MKLYWIVALVFLASFASADIFDPVVTDDYDYKAFNDLAIEELEQERAFLKELAEDTAGPRYAFGVFLADYEDELDKFDIVVHRDGVSSILACLYVAGDDAARKKVWDKISTFSKDKDGDWLSCGDLDLNPYEASAAAAVAGASKVSVEQIPELEVPFNYNPVLAVLIQMYLAKETPNKDLVDGRIGDVTLGAAQYREELATAMFVDFGRLKYRFSRGAGVRYHFFETLLTDDERWGLSVLAECIRQDDLPREWAAYARNGDFPSDGELYTIAYFHPCVYGGKTVVSREYLEEKIAIEVIRNRFAALGLAIQGRNVFLAKGSNQARPSIVYDYLFAENEEQREEAATSILAIDLFVNQEVAAMRQSVSSRTNFRGIGSLSAAERVILTDVLEKRFLEKNQAKLKKIKVFKAVINAGESCALGVALGEFIGGGIGVVSRVFFSPAATPHMRATGVLLLSGFSVWAAYKSAGEAVDLVNTYKDIPLQASLAQGCAVAADLMEFGLQGLSHAALKNVKKNAAAVKPDVVPNPKTRALPEGVLPAAQSVPTRSTAQRVADAMGALFSDPGSIDVGALSRQWADSALSRAKDGLDSSVRWVRQRFQEVLSQHPSARQELLDLTSREYKTKLDDLRRQFDNADTPSQKAEITKQLKSAKEEAVGDLFETAITDPRLLLVQARDGSWRLVYVPKNPADVGIPRSIVDQFTTFQKSVKDAGVDTFALRATPGTAANPHGVYIDSLSNYHAHFENPDVTLGEKVRMLSDLYTPRQVVGGGPEVEALMRQTRKQMLDNFRANLPYQDYDDLTNILDQLIDPDTFVGTEDGVAKALQFHFDRAAASDDYNTELMTLVIAALDPNIPAGIDPVGRHAAFLTALGSREGIQASGYVNTRRRQLADELDERLTRFFENPRDEENNKAIENLQKQLRELSEAGGPQEKDFLRLRREYEEAIILGFVGSTQNPDGLGPHYPAEHLEYLLSTYGFLAEGREAFYQRLNDQWRTTLDDAVRRLSGGDLSIDDVRRVAVNRKLGSGGERTAYSITIQTKGGQQFRLVGKTGRTDPGEVLFFEQLKGTGHVPEVYRVIYGGEQGFMLQEEVIGKTLRKKLAETPPGPERDAILRAVADLKEELASRGIDIGDAGGKNIVIRDSDGKAILIDADTRQLTNRDELDVLTFDFVRMDLDFAEADFQAFFRQLLDRYKQRYGDEAGTARFLDLLKQARDDIEGGVFNLLPRYVDANDDLKGSADFLIHLFQGQFRTEAGYVHPKTKLDADGNVVPDFDWNERIPRAIDEFLDRIGQGPPKEEAPGSFLDDLPSQPSGVSDEEFVADLVDNYIAPGLRKLREDTQTAIRQSDQTGVQSAQTLNDVELRALQVLAEKTIKDDRTIIVRFGGAATRANKPIHSDWDLMFVYVPESPLERTLVPDGVKSQVLQFRDAARRAGLDIDAEAAPFAFVPNTLNTYNDFASNLGRDPLLNLLGSTALLGSQYAAGGGQNGRALYDQFQRHVIDAMFENNADVLKRLLLENTPETLRQFNPKTAADLNFEAPDLKSDPGGFRSHLGVVNLLKVMHYEQTGSVIHEVDYVSVYRIARDNGYITAQEFSDLTNGIGFLQEARNQLHAEMGREFNVLQETQAFRVANRMGYPTAQSLLDDYNQYGEAVVSVLNNLYERLSSSLVNS